jgi:hypothetical protein
LQNRQEASSDQLRQLEQDAARQVGQIAALEKALSETYTAVRAKRKNASGGSNKATATRIKQRASTKDSKAK